MWGWRSSRTAVILVAATIFVIVCILPPAYMLAAIFRSTGPVAALTAALLDSRQLTLLATTVVLGVATATMASVIGAVLGLALARTTLPYKAALRIALAAPAVLPPYVIALAWISLAGGEAFSTAGAVVVLTVAFYPLSMLATEVGLRRIDPRLEEAGLIVTTPARVFQRITGPLTLPHVISAALVIFVLAISEFSVPGLLRVRVFTTEVFTAFAGLYDFGRATVLSLPLLIVSFAVAACAAITSGQRVITSKRPIHGAVPLAFDRWNVVALIVVTGAIGLFSAAPLAALVGEAVQSHSLGADLLSSRAAVANSLGVAVAAATIAAALGTALGYVRARATPSVAAVLDTSWVVLFTVPSTVVGIGLIAMWNRSGALGVYGTRIMLVLAALARFAPIGALAIAAVLRSVPDSHEEAAALAGAGWWRTMMRIVLPQIHVGLIAVWVVVFILAFGEVGASILVAPPGESTLPIRVYTLTANAPPGHVAALALFQALVVLCPLTLLGIAATRREPR
jgi:iron(III) transport system permease protein